MKPIYHTLSVAAIFFAGFSLYGQKSVYTLPFENEYRLPAMQTRINSEDIANTYQTMGNIYTTEITGLGEEKMEQTSMTFISDAKIAYSGSGVVDDRQRPGWLANLLNNAWPF